MKFQEMSQDRIQELLEQKDENGAPVYADVLTPLIKREESYFKLASCPSCRGSSLEPFIDPSRPFVQGNPLPHKQLRCLACETEFDPYTGLILKATGGSA